MITRACISINNQCNLRCNYCHFKEKEEFIENEKMDIFKILDNIKYHIDKYEIPIFKLGFVGNGEPLLEYENLKEYIMYISNYLKSEKISSYIITNGLLIDEEKINFFKEFNINIGFSIDGIKSIHDKWRCNSFDKVMEKIELYKSINNRYPSMNCTVGRDTIEHIDEIIEFFKKFNNKITFSRMIGQYGITLTEYREFIEKVKSKLNVRIGTYDCTMYGGMCGAGMDNIFYSNGKIFICGNCINLKNFNHYTTPLHNIDFNINYFDRNYCYKESIEVAK